MLKTLRLSKLPYQKTLITSSILFVIGATSILGFSPYKFYPIALLCYSGLYLINYQMRFWQSFSFFYGQTLFGCYWLYNSIVNFGMLPTSIGVILTAVAITIIAAIPAILGPIARKYKLISWPIWIAGAEIIRSYYLFSGFPWLLLGYTQIHSPWYKLIYFLNIHGSSFITALAISFFCEAFRQKRKIHLVPVVIWLSSIYFLPTHTTSKARTYCFQAHRPKSYFDISTKELVNNKRNIDFSIWPEGVIHHPLKYNELQDLKKVKVLTIFGGITQKDSKFFNSTIAVYPGGNITYHRKYNLVAFGEYFPMRKFIQKIYNIPFMDMNAADKNNQRLIKLNTNTYILPILCYDIGFSSWMHPVIDKASFLISLHQMIWFDSKQALAQQIEMAQARSIESGKPQIFVEHSIGHIVIKPNGKIISSNCLEIN